MYTAHICQMNAAGLEGCWYAWNGVVDKRSESEIEMDFYDDIPNPTRYLRKTGKWLTSLFDGGVGRDWPKEKILSLPDGGWFNTCEEVVAVCKKHNIPYDILYTTCN